MKKLDRGGFTMVELLIVLAIIAILAAVAIPVYSSQLEASRKKVDESNLRAATGIAAQDYIVRNAGSTQGGTASAQGTQYRVYTLKDNTGAAGDAKNMMVFAVGDKVSANGEVITGTSPAAVFTVASNTGVNSLNERTQKVNTSGQVNGKDVYYYPIQQNGGKGYFNIIIGENGVVKTSAIVTFAGP